LRLESAVELVALLLAFGADPGAVDDNGATPVKLATRAGSDGLVKILSSHKAGAGAADGNAVDAAPCPASTRSADPARLRHQLTAAAFYQVRCAKLYCPSERVTGQSALPALSSRWPGNTRSQATLKQTHGLDPFL
jgi:hypothetical protein